MRLLLSTLMVLVILRIASAQQDPLYAQYFMNPVLINPGYTGAQTHWQTALTYRSQWNGIPGAPTTTNLSTHLPMLDNRVGVGLIISQDKIGDSKNTSISVNYAYHIRSENVSFHFGLSSGIVNYDLNSDDLILEDNSDPFFANVSKSTFNAGAGLLARSDRFIAGISVPRLLPSTIREGGQSLEIYQQHYYFYGGYRFLLNERVELKPATMIRATNGAPLSADLSLNALWKSQYGFGLLSRNLKTYGASILVVLNSFRLGYIFEMPTNGSVGQSFTSHEVMLSFSLTALPSHSIDLSSF